MISIVTINYNNKSGLEKTITSVVNQVNCNFEYILIDGGSTDGSVEVLEGYSNKIDFWVSEPDKGIYNAMNKGIKKSIGDYLIFLNSGDVLVDKHVLARVTPKLKEKKGIFYGNLIYYVGNQKHIKKFPSKLNFKYFFKESLPHPASFIKRDLFNEIFLYNENYKIVSDWEFFMVAILKEKCSYKHLDMPVSVFDVNGISCSSQGQKIIAKERKSCIKKHFPFHISNFIGSKMLRIVDKN